MKIRVLLAPSLALFLWVAPGVASPIFISNPSFENPSCGGAGPAVCAPTGWTINTAGGLANAFLPPASAWDSIPDGGQIGWSNGGTLSQLLTATILPDTTYTLSVWVSQRNTAGTFQPEIELIGGSTALFTMNNLNPGGAAPTTNPDTTYQWVDWVMSWNSPSSGPLIGQALTIQLGSDGIQTDFDNVSLTASPEPGTLVLLGAGLIGFGLRRRFAK